MPREFNLRPAASGARRPAHVWGWSGAHPGRVQGTSGPRPGGARRRTQRPVRTSPCDDPTQAEEGETKTLSLKKTAPRNREGFNAEYATQRPSSTKQTWAAARRGARFGKIPASQSVIRIGRAWFRPYPFEIGEMRSPRQLTESHWNLVRAARGREDMVRTRVCAMRGVHELFFFESRGGRGELGAPGAPGGRNRREPIHRV